MPGEWLSPMLDGSNIEGKFKTRKGLIAMKKGNDKVATLIKEKLKEPLPENTACIICIDQMPDVVLVPCGHQNMCGPCAHKSYERRKFCPLDRIEISEILPLKNDE